MAIAAIAIATPIALYQIPDIMSETLYRSDVSLVAIPTVNITRRSVLIVGAGLLLVTAVALKSRSTTAPEAIMPTALAVTAATPQLRSLQRTATATGSFQPWQELVVGPEVGGYRVADVHVDVGDSVRKGEELARLNADMLDVERAAKRAALKKAQAQRTKAQADFNRAKTLAASKLVSVAELERLQTELASSTAEMELAQADLDTAELRLRHTRIIAPANGVISARKVNIGQIAQVNEEMFRLLRDGRIEWHADIPEALLPRIHAGQQVSIELADGTALHGSVRVVAPTVNTSNRSATVYVSIPQPGSARTGMFARGEFALDTAQVITVPLTSLVSNDGYSYVFVLHSDLSVERRRVHTGQIDGDTIEVRNGLAANEKIVDAGAGFLKDGDRVRVVAGQQAQKKDL